jgi:polyketide synthase PksN
MNSQEVFKALKSGKITREDAKKELMKQITAFDISKLGDHYGLVLSTVYSLDELMLQPWTVPEPGKDEVTIRVRASAINFPDVMCIRGLYPTMPDYPFVPGFEVSGVVTRVGGQVSEFNVGDEVIAVTGKQMGGHAGLVNVPQTNIVHKPQNISFEEACSLPVVFGTVSYAFDIGRIAPQEHVLIQTATGGCGLMAVQLANLTGCVCYGTSSKQEKLDILRQLEIPFVINYKTTEFDREIKRLTHNRGVDVVLNMLSGEGIQKGLNCLAPSGRYLEIAVQALKASQKLDLSKLVQNQSIYSIDLRRLGLEKGFNARESLKKMVSLIQAEKIVPIVSRVYPVEQIKEAMEYVGQGRHIGKVVISHTSQTMTDFTDKCIRRLLEQKRSSARNSLFPVTKSFRTIEEPGLLHEGIAIIGMSGQFPKSKTLTAFWDNLAQSTDCISEIPASRWSIAQYYDPDPLVPGKTNCKWMGVLEDIDKFDPLFFNISPAEAELMDPQQRLFLENCWHCIEDAGLSPASLSGSRCGVFAGCAAGDYGLSMNGQGPNAQSLMGGSTSILAARISYLLNLKGPCLAIDTACSSSLVAIAEACNSLILKTSDLALAGGVCVMTSPLIHIMTTKAGMLSKDGRCFTFDTRANGFVPGEGVGVILLKRLSDAIRDQDPIHGVIRGWGINQDGRTNGITAPSVNSQINLEKEVFERFAIDPAKITLAEAHGTGTKLGDPIEVEALTAAFQSLTRRKNYCALGSVKSNIGHLLTAAGISGVIKVLLAMQHQMLSPTIHYETLNEHISLKNSPFYINTKLQPWEVNPGIPRCASVSSFGFSGTNAFMVIEEYPGSNTVKTAVPDNSNLPLLFTLSAKNEEQLQNNAEQMKSYIESHETLNLADMTYTLQVGREAMDCRLAILAPSREALLEKLADFISNRFSAGMMIARVKKNEDKAAFEAGEDPKTLPRRLTGNEQLQKTAELWVKGLKIDWNLLYGDIKPRRIHIPTYPFVKERYWVPEIDTKRTLATNMGITSYIHPLLQQNTSDLSEQRYSSTFTGREFFLKDHVIMGQRVLPGVAYLEMARAAVASALNGIAFNAAATGSSKESNATIQLKNIIWVRPIVVGEQPAQVHIGLYPEDDGEIAYEIYSLEDTYETEPVVYSQGSVVLVENPRSPVLDLQAIRAECSQRNLSAAEVYDYYKATGLEYGPGLRGIETIYAGQGRVIAKLSLPDSVAGTEEQYVLHPSIMDGALQAAIGMETGDGNTFLTKPSLPFALQELEVYSRCTGSIWAVLRYSKNNIVADKIQKFDIELCDEQGQVCARMKGLEMQEEMEANSHQAVISETQKQPYELMTFEEVWQEQALPEASSVPLKTIVCFLSKPENQPEIIDALSTSEQQTNLIFISQGADYQKQTPQNYSIAKADRNTYEEAFRSIRGDYDEIGAILYMWALEDSRAGARSCIKDYSSIIYIIQSMAITGLRTKRILLAANVTKGSLEGCYAESWIGFERSLGMILNNTQIAAIYQATELNQETAMKDWGQKLRKELQTPILRSVMYQNSQRYISKIRPITISSSNSLLRTGGTYLITGGCGGLGFLFAKYIAQKHPVNLVLTGRSAMDAEKQKKIKLLEDLGSQVMYLQANVGNTNAMKAKLKQARERFGRIDGVIHAAGIAGTQSILEKGPDDFQKVIGPKIAGTQVLDKVLKEEPLDFVCYFSSSAAILGDFGSCDYAVGNRFLMAYAHYRNREVSQGLCHGKTVAINWPLWREGGMGFGNDENTKLYLKTSGQRVLETEEGVAVFDQILGQTGAQYLIIAGQPSRVHRFLGLTEEQPVMAPVVNSGSPVKRRRVEMKGLSTKQCLEWELTEQIHIVTKIPRDKIGRDENLADFGLDSIGLDQLARMLTNHYGMEITPALFYGYSTVAKLTQYFMENHSETINRFYQETVAEKVIEAPISAAQPLGIKRTRFIKNAVKSEPEPIAIIGMSGRFPGARNIDELWTILATGQDMVKEIPEERFDWRQYYGDPVNQPGKTNCKWCGCIPGVREFEPLFFEISPKEAETMDPRQRLLLQESWKALEDAGYGKAQLTAEKIGMFVGVEQGDYLFLTRGEGDVSANNNAILAARLAYFLNLSGPVMAINTACSSGLTAAHQAILSLRSGECDTAIIAGVSLLLTPGPFIAMSQAGMLSEAGKCYAFDKRANGMVPGEAVAVVVLKRLSRAEADGDPIYAVIRGSGMNYDGKTNGITAPSGVSQTELLKQVYDRYQVNPEEIEYIVTHGTGTRLGDPVEINALYDAFKNYSCPGTSRYSASHPDAPRAGTRKQGYCALTSTKTNFGHTFAASGLVSLISLVQALRHEMIPASLHCEQENDYINWKESPFYVNKANKPWPGAASGAFRDGRAISGNRVRTGAVSAFGMSGTNVHIVVESYFNTKTYYGEEAPYYLLAFSAKTDETLLEKAQDMIKVLENETNIYLSQLSFTLLQGRQHFNHRCAVVVQEREDAIYVLKHIKSKEKIPNLFQGKVPWDFTGQKVIAEYAQELLKQSQTLKVNRSKYQEMLFGLAELYCQGYELDWSKLFGDIKPQRVHLPSYPFAREEYWVRPDKQENTPAQIMLQDTPQVEKIFNETFYEQLLNEVSTGKTDTMAAALKTRQRIATLGRGE